MKRWICASLLLLSVFTGSVGSSSLLHDLIDTFLHPGGTSNTHRRSCTDINGYRELDYIFHHDLCVGAHQVFSALLNITGKGFAHDCRKELLKKFAAKYPSGTKTPRQCSCTGVNKLLKYPAVHDVDAPGYHACNHDRHYMALYKMMFLPYDSAYDHYYHHYHNTAPTCQTHHTIWYDMYHVAMTKNCNYDIIARIATTYERNPDPCTCKARTTAIPTTTSTTTTPTTATPTTTSTTSTTTTARSTTTPTTAAVVTTTSATTSTSTRIQTKPSTNTLTEPLLLYSSKFHCDRLKVVMALASDRTINGAYTTNCTNRGSNDGFVLAECNSTSPTTWQRGLPVRPLCEHIPVFTPIATFDHRTTSYSPTGAMSGIFFGCLSNGFKMLVEYCGQTQKPTIVHVLDGGVFVNNPQNYYTIN